MPSFLLVVVRCVFFIVISILATECIAAIPQRGEFGSYSHRKNTICKVRRSAAMKLSQENPGSSGFRLLTA